MYISNSNIGYYEMVIIINEVMYMRKNKNNEKYNEKSKIISICYGVGLILSLIF